MKDNVENGYFKQFLKGDLFAVLFTVLMLLIFAVVLTYTSISESIIPQTIIIITAISILLGSSIGTMKMKTKGLISGAIIALIYILTIYVLSSVFNGDFSFSVYSIIMCVCSVLCGMIGGIIGVNINI